MYNPRNYAIIIGKILGVDECSLGKIEHNPLGFLSSFLDNKYGSNEAIDNMIDALDSKFSRYNDVPLISWDEEDTKQLINDLKKIFAS